jgi:putative aldouronate transport system substrate-binding protein
MFKTTKLIALIVAITLLGSLSIGCGKKDESSTATQETKKTEATATQPEATAAQPETVSDVPKDFVTLQAIYPGDVTPRMEEFLNSEFKAKMKEDLNMELQLTWIPWAQYWQKRDMMLAAREVVDWYWDGFPNINLINSRKQAAPIDELLQKYGQDILKVIPEKSIKAATINGKLMALPSTFCPAGANFQMVDIRQDILEEVGMTEIKTTADLAQFAEKAKAKYPDMNAASDSIILALQREFADQGYVFISDAYMLCIGQKDNKVYSFYETDAFKKAAKFNRDLFVKKQIPEEVTIKFNEKDPRMTSGKYLWGEASIGKPTEIIQALQKNAPNAKLKAYLLGPGSGKHIATPGGEILCLPPTAKNPERAMMFFNWMFKSKDNYLMALYGVKDKDWKLENGRIKTLTNDTFFYEWMFRNVNYQEFPDYIADDYINQYKNWDSDAEYANCFGFIFDSANVKNVEAKCKQEIETSMRPIMTGFVDFDKNYDKALAALKAAGIDQYKDECQKQFDAFLASKK